MGLHLALKALEQRRRPRRRHGHDAPAAAALGRRRRLGVVLGRVGQDRRLALRVAAAVLPRRRREQAHRGVALREDSREQALCRVRVRVRVGSS